MKISKFFLSAVLVLVFPLAANAAVFNLAATLTPGAEVPPVTAPGAMGDAAMVLNDVTGMFAWIISFEGLTGPAVAAHFHEAPAGMNGGVVLDLDTDPGVIFSGLGADSGIFAGATTLSADAVMTLLSGNWYINIHTEANGGGEIRGQVLGGTFNPIPLPATAWLFLSGLAGLLIVKRTKTSNTV
ncbi:MAG: CHRD domain-containing protein [Pseudomonadales bacterium]